MNQITKRRGEKAMNYSVLENSALFSGVPAKELRDVLETVPHHIVRYDRGETVFHLMEDAPNGSQINVSIRNPGELIGPAAVFSQGQKYPCDIVSLEPAAIMIFRREDILLLLQKDLRIMKNFMTELATATYMLQQRLEMLSYSGIAQKAAFYLLIHARQSGSNVIRIPDSVSNWAMIMNVSRSSLHRELKKLEADGIITYDPPTIKILDPESLQNVLSR